MKLIEDIGFKSVAERVKDEKATREKMLSGIIPYNNAFLRKVLGGIFPGEVVLIGGETGSGKSEMAKEILLTSAQSGAKSFGFFLEADEAEMERRWKYNVLTKLYYSHGGKAVSEYRSWMLGQCRHLDSFESEANAMLSKHQNLYTFYKGDVFTIHDLKTKLLALDGHAQVVVLDHLHFFSLTTENESREMTEIMMEIRRLSQVTGIPIVLVAHLRKKISGEVRGDIPTLDDFHGASAIQKIANTAILFGTGGEDPENKGRFITYIQAAKMRAGGKSRTSLAGRMYFNTRTNSYDDEWEPGEVKNGRFTVFKDQEQLPSWWGL